MNLHEYRAYVLWLKTATEEQLAENARHLERRAEDVERRKASLLRGPWLNPIWRRLWA